MKCLVVTQGLQAADFGAISDPVGTMPGAFRVVVAPVGTTLADSANERGCTWQRCAVSGPNQIKVGGNDDPMRDLTLF